MLRKLHSLSAWLAALFIVTLAVTGAILSIAPAMERAAVELPAAGRLDVAELSERIGRHYPNVEQIERRPSGAIVVYYRQQDQNGADLVNPLTGQAIAPYQPSIFFRWIRQLHRSLLLDSPGQAVAGITALVMLILSVSGTLMLARQLGGVRRLLGPLTGSGSKRVHAELARAALAGLLLSALTGLYMSAMTFGLVAAGTPAEPEWPTITANGKPAEVSSLAALQATDLNELKELVYPYPDDPTDVYSLRTTQGASYVDPYTGERLSYQSAGKLQGVYAFIVMLHTGEGLWWLGLLLGLCALAVPVLSVTGVQIWWLRRGARPKLANNCGGNTADTVILVGSEANSTWGFASTLHNALTAAGHSVHTAPMNHLASGYRRARQLLILTATYGDGDAPTSGSHFLARLARIQPAPNIRFAVLGFGDQQFPQFCQFAKEVEAALLAGGWPQLLSLETIDRQSTQAFSRWGQHLAQVIGHKLELLHTPRRQPTLQLQLAERVDYGAKTEAPTSVLRFTMPANMRTNSSGHRRGAACLPPFSAGDLVGIYPPNSPVPRLYSLASAATDGQLEICVRKHVGGLCSGFLHALQPSDLIEAFIQPHPAFRPLAGRTPMILIGAGTGLGPLIGFIRHNTQKRPVYLYWGGRDPQSDFLYQPELEHYLADRRLTQLSTAFSRVSAGCYVQDRVMADSVLLGKLLAEGAHVMVCGGRGMADSVMEALNTVLVASRNMDVQTLKIQGRYREDVY